jgi:hypothetical protein
MQPDELEKLAAQLLPKKPPASLRDCVISATTKALSSSEPSGRFYTALAKWAVGLALVLVALNAITEIRLSAYVAERLPVPHAQSTAGDLEQLMVELRGGSAISEPLLAVPRLHRKPLLSLLEKRKQDLSLMAGHATADRSDRRSWR